MAYIAAPRPILVLRQSEEDQTHLATVMAVLSARLGRSVTGWEAALAAIRQVAQTLTAPETQTASVQLSPLGL